MVRALFNLFYPKSCKACDDPLVYGEDMICADCRHYLPVTHLHYGTQIPIQKLLYGRVEIHLGTSLFYFDKKSRVQQLIHNLKYRGHEKISSFLGKWLGSELSEIDAYEKIDCVVPVPLHKTRRRERGYNQVAGFGKAIAVALDIPYVDDVLYRTKSTKTQVFLSRKLRSADVIDSFDIKEEKILKGKHILLVDDLITTGGTIEGCALALQKIPGCKISVAVMAIAH
tara:strand:- start:126 stop:806 length:681 start_codon:yes stop_codon:yes gene_type:complete